MARSSTPAPQPTQPMEISLQALSTMDAATQSNQHNQTTSSRPVPALIPAKPHISPPLQPESSSPRPEITVQTPDSPESVPVRDEDQRHQQEQPKQPPRPMTLATWSPHQTELCQGVQGITLTPPTPDSLSRVGSPISRLSSSLATSPLSLAQQTGAPDATAQVTSQVALHLTGEQV